MVRLRRFAAGAVACATLALGIGGTANAADPAASTPAARQAVTHTAPSAPVGVQNFGPTATSPYTSPASTAGHVNPGQTYTCEYQYLCELAWDPTTGNWELFKQATCNLYHVYYWNGTGYHWNNQTRGTQSTFLGEGDKTVLWRDTAPTPQTYANWDKVYSFRNC